jgi:hypothetical protein
MLLWSTIIKRKIECVGENKENYEQFNNLFLPRLTNELNAISVVGSN